VGFVALTDPGIDDLGLMCSFSQEKIKEMECELLVSNFRDPKTVALVKENIGRSSDGSSSHRAGALKLGLRKAIELKKQKKQPPGASLRCGNHQCARHNNPAPCSSTGSALWCLYSSSCCSYYFLCGDCGHQRTSYYTSCQSCGKNFV